MRHKSVWSSHGTFGEEAKRVHGAQAVQRGICDSSVLINPLPLVSCRGGRAADPSAFVSAAFQPDGGDDGDVQALTSTSPESCNPGQQERWQWPEQHQVHTLF